MSPGTLSVCLLCNICLTLIKNIRNLSSKKSLWVQFNDSIQTELCLKLWFESDSYFCNITESGWFWKRLPRNKAWNNHFLQSVWKATSQNSMSELWTVISNQKIKYQLSHTRFDQTPSKHLLVLSKSSKLLQRNNFSSSKTSWRRLEDVL